MTAVLRVLLGYLEQGLDWLADVEARVELRHFLKDHPEVRLYYPDGERAPND